MGCGYGWHKAAQHDARPQDGGRHCGIRLPRDLAYTRRYPGVGRTRATARAAKGRGELALVFRASRVGALERQREDLRQEQREEKGKNFKSVSRRQQQNIKIKINQ